MNSGGVGFFGVLVMIFVVLKLVEVIAWSWWWVLSPIWLPTVAGIAVFICAVLLSAGQSKR